VRLGARFRRPFERYEKGPGSASRIRQALHHDRAECGLRPSGVSSTVRIKPSSNDHECQRPASAKADVLLNASARPPLALLFESGAT
jgi:hypothetical protein